MNVRDFTVIIPTRGGAELLPMALAHLEVQSYPAAQFEIIVVDYGRSGESSDLLERYSAGAPVRTRCLKLPEGNCAGARNLATREAEGRWLLFLDEDLLAGPGLVEAHAAAHARHGEGAAVVGRVQVHPQVHVRVFTKRWRTCASEEAAQSDRLGLVDWTFCNLSLSRAAFQAAGGFDEEFDVEGLQDLALAWRLLHQGITAHYGKEAAAYTWRPMRLVEERRRQYLNGYSLYGLLKKVDAEELRRCFPIAHRRLGACVDRLLQPIYRRLCDPLAENTRSFDYLCERILSHDFYRGYRDAAAGRPALFVFKGMVESPRARASAVSPAQGKDL